MRPLGHYARLAIQTFASKTPLLIHSHLKQIDVRHECVYCIVNTTILLFEYRLRVNYSLFSRIKLIIRPKQLSWKHGQHHASLETSDDRIVHEIQKLFS